jgi:type IV secretory pathway ATPase VirB11/archaellum biosynthesis ATPase
MRGVVQKLVENPDVNLVVLADVYEREYSGPGLDALRELAYVFDESQQWAFRYLVNGDCKRCEAERRQQLKHVIDLLPGDPRGARDELRQLAAEIRMRAKRGAKQCKKCRNFFIERTLQPMLSSLKLTKLAAGSRGQRRRGYAKFLNPLIRPYFTTSRISVEPPPNVELVDAYNLNDSEVRIYRLPSKLQHLYFLIPSEYRLSPEHVSLLHRARQSLFEHPPENLDFSGPLHAREYFERLGRNVMTKFVVEDGLNIEKKEVETLANCLAKFTAGLGVLETLLSDARVQDIYVDAPVGKSPVYIYHRDYEECVTNIFLSPESMESLISRFRAISGRPFSEADPVLDLNLKGVRVAAIGHPLSPEGVALALRRHKPTPWTLPQFVRNRFLTPEAAGLLSLLVDSQSSILVTGSRGAGKTSLLGALMLEILPKFRILCLEDTAELPVEQLRALGFKVQSLRTQSVVAGTDVELRAEDALRAALRLGESVLVIGECRGPEVKTLYEAMRVGAAGNSVMGTIHGSSARDVFERVVYDLGVPPSSFKATDVIVVAAPIRPRGSTSRVRRVTQITEVRKTWQSDPAAESGFADLMRYDPAADGLRLTPILTKPRSQLIDVLARKWNIRPAEVLQNFKLRTRICDFLVRRSIKLRRPEILEADFVVRSNLVFHGLLEEQLRHKAIDYNKIFEHWCKWFEKSAKGEVQIS